MVFFRQNSIRWVFHSKQKNCSSLHHRYRFQLVNTGLLVCLYRLVAFFNKTGKGASFSKYFRPDASPHLFFTQFSKKYQLLKAWRSARTSAALSITNGFPINWNHFDGYLRNRFRRIERTTACSRLFAPKPYENHAIDSTTTQLMRFKT